MIETTIETIDGFIINFDQDEIKTLIENYIFEKLYDKLFVVLDDDEMKNVQIREKIKILQQYVKPSMLGIEKKHLNMKLMSRAITGNVIRNAKVKFSKESKNQIYNFQ